MRRARCHALSVFLAVCGLGGSSPLAAQIVIHSDDMVYLGGGVSARAGDLRYTTITPNRRMIAEERALLALAPLLSGKLGSDYSKEELADRGQIVKEQIPVHGYWVNWEDVFFYTGDTQAFNQFVEAYAKTEHLRLKVVVHSGTTGARSPWDKGDRGAADWSFYRWNSGGPGKPAPSQLDVWLGSKIKLADLRIPPNVEVTSGGEIEKFIAERKAPKPVEKVKDQ